jgi:hypothetical protein
MMTKKNHVCLVIPDLHVPYQDKKFVKLTYKLIELIKPTTLIQLGDFIDCYSCSRFDKSPDRMKTVHEEIMEARSIIDKWDRLMPEGSNVHLLEGNHEYRTTKTKNKYIPQLQGMVKSIPDIYGFDTRNKFGRNNFHWHEFHNWASCKIGDVLFHHGNFFNQNISISNLTRYQCKFVQGHCHRTQFADDGRIWTVSLGHGLDVAQIDYLANPVTWSQAIGKITFIDGIGHLEVLRVNNGTCFYQGEIIIS